MDNSPLSHTRTALYLQLAEIMRQRIRKGAWKPGSVLPSFDVLAREFHVARVTVRQAVKMLEGEGMLAPRRGLGTTVLPLPDPVRPLQLHSRFSDLVETYRGDRPVLANVEEGEGPLPETPVEGKPAALYHHIRRIHSRGDERYCLISIYLAKDVFDRHPRNFREELVLPVMADDPGIEIARVRQSMVISKCDLETAGQIGIPIGDPVAEVRRIILDRDDRIIYWADVTYRGDYIRLDMELTP